MTLGEWTFEPELGRLARPDQERRLEPKVADLLLALIEAGGNVVSKDELSEALWPDVVVGDDALPRCVSKLRRALDDEPRNPRYVETLPKRGYRLLVEPAPVPTPDRGLADRGLAEPALSERARSDPGPPEPAPSEAVRRPRWWLLAAAGLAVVVLFGALAWSSGLGTAPLGTAPLGTAPLEPVEPVGPGSGDGARKPSRARVLAERADDFYFQINRADNESAIELYERALTADPELAPAHAGLANALVQRVLRYPRTESLPPIEPVDLGNALASGRLATPEARHHLERALGLAERAVRLAPRSAPSHKALGFVVSALGRREEAIRTYERALELDPDAWDVWINLGDLRQIGGDSQGALDAFENAHRAMTRVYDEQGSRVRPWYAEMGVLIGEGHEAAGRPGEAEVWYRQVLGLAPLHPRATCALARLLRQARDDEGADRLLRELAERTGEAVDCPARSAQLESS